MPNAPHDPDLGFDAIDAAFEAKESSGEAVSYRIKFRDFEKHKITIIEGAIDKAADAAESALRDSPADIYVFGGQLVMLQERNCRLADGSYSRSLCLLPIPVWHMVEMLARVAEFSKPGKKRGQDRRIDPPRPLAEMVLARPNYSFPVLAGLVSCPTLRADGSVLDRPGFDRRSGLLYEPGGTIFPSVPDKPTRHDAMAAIDQLNELLAGFPFVITEDGHSPDHAVALSAIITGIVRPGLLRAPLHAFSAPAASAGKSYLCDIIATIATGRRAPVMTQAKDDVEFEKHLSSQLLSAEKLITIDNCERKLGGDLLCQAISQDVLSKRFLGLSRAVEVASVATFLATGNNLQLADDMVRRTLLARLDPKVERPEHREFTANPLASATDRRPELVIAGLTIVRAYLAAGCPDQHLTPLAGFDRWSRWVRGALVWLGQSDPVMTQATARSENEDVTTLAALLTAWSETVGPRPVTVPELIAEANGDQMLGFGGDAALRASLADIAGQPNGPINSRKLGRWLARNADRIVDGLRLQRAGIHHKAQRWVLDRIA